MEDNGYFIKGLFAKFALPSVLTLVGAMFCLIVNTIMAGMFFKSDGVSVIGICSPITYLFTCCGSLLGTGAANQAAQYIALDDDEGVNNLYSVAVACNIILGLCLSFALLTFLNPITEALAVSSVLFDSVKKYCAFYIPFGVFTMFQYVPVNFARIDGKPRVGSTMFVIMGILQIVCNIVSVKYFGLGIEGFAVSTSIAMIGANVYGTLCVHKKGGHIKFVLSKKMLTLLPAVIVTGSPMALRNASLLMRAFFLNMLVINIGNTASIAVFSIINSITAFATAIMSGIGQAIVPLVGVFMREKDFTSIKQVLKQAFLYGYSLIIPVSLGLIVFSDSIGKLFGVTDPLVLSMLKSALLCLSVSLLVALINIVYTFYCMSVSRIAIANILAFTRGFLYSVLIAYALAPMFSVDGVWYSVVLTEVTLLFTILACSVVVVLRDNHLSMFLFMDKQMEQRGEYLSFSVDNNVQSIVGASEKTSEFCKRMNIDSKKAMLISLSVEEIIMLILNNGMKNDLYQVVAVRLFIFDNTIMLRFRNNGQKFDPIAYYTKTISNDIEKSIDVIGIKYLISKAKSIYYKETFGINNLVIVFTAV